ncbi:MAG: hypothetical protein ACOC32_04795, partial [Nanoarchaeota archaeon]
MLLTLVSTLLAALLSVSVSADMPPDGIYFVRPESSERETVDFRPEYVTDEALVFYSCIEGAERVFNSVYCKADPTNLIELDAYPWKDDCFISSYELNDSTCSELVVMSEYEEDDEILKWDQEVVVADVDSIPHVILDSQTSDGGWSDPVSTAWVIWALSEFSRGDYQNNTYSEQIEAGLTWLKKERDEDDKCWDGPDDEEG